MSFEYINETYGTEFKNGSIVDTCNGKGVVVGTHSASLKVKVGGVIGVYHPTWNLKLL